MKNSYWALSCFLFLIGCAGIEPAKIESGIYMNPAYEFSIQPPNGWEMSKEIPGFLKTNMSYSEQKNFKATFYDPNCRRFILVSAEKTAADWMSFKMYTDKFISSLNSYFAREKKRFLKSAGSRYYRYDIYRGRITKCSDACKAASVKFKASNTTARGCHVIYKSRYGKLYTAGFILMYREKGCEGEENILQEVVDSFQHQ